MSSVLVEVALGLAAIFSLVSLLTYATRRLNVGLVTAELCTGVLLGPTVLGRAAAEVYAALFNAGPANVQVWFSVSQTCLLLFLFAAGMELHINRIRRPSSMLLAGAFGTLIPLFVGFSVVVSNPKLWNFPSSYGPFIPALVAGTLFSISALPVILRVLYDLRLHRTIVGEIIIGGAILDDLLGWIIFGAIAHTISGHFDWVGSHGMFLAFLGGIALGNSSFGSHSMARRAQVFIFRFCSPVYFASIALRVDFAKQWDTALILILLVVSSAAKIGGVTLGAQLSGATSFRQSLAIGCGMNARGAMGIVLASTALNYGFLTQRLFAAFICVAVATSVASGPLMRFLLRPDGALSPAAPDSITAS